VIITLKPAYPKGTTAEDQREKLREEFREIVVARSESNWKELASEYLDLAQVAIGLLEIEYNEKWTANIKRLISIVNQREKEIYDVAGECFYRVCTSRLKSDVEALIDICICCFVSLVMKNDRGSKKIRKELIEQFIDQHQQKLASRREEWGKCTAQDVGKKSI